MANFFILKCMEYNLRRIMRSRGIEEHGKVQRYIDSKVLEYCQPKVPKDNGFLIDSGKEHTTIGDGQVKYHCNYARRWYYMPAEFQGAPERGNYWFERMKQQYKKQILAGAERVAKGG